MTLQEKKTKFKEHYKEKEFELFFTEEYETITSIDFENEIVYYYVNITASCGCCSYPEDRETDLDDFLEYLSDNHFEELISR